MYNVSQLQDFWKRCVIQPHARLVTNQKQHEHPLFWELALNQKTFLWHQSCRTLPNCHSIADHIKRCFKYIFATASIWHVTRICLVHTTQDMQYAGLWLLSVRRVAASQTGILRLKIKALKHLEDFEQGLLYEIFHMSLILCKSHKMTKPTSLPPSTLPLEYLQMCHLLANQKLHVRKSLTTWTHVSLSAGIRWEEQSNP